MANVHIIKNTTCEAVLKCYLTDSAGGNVDIDISTLALANETYVEGTSSATLKALYWGVKNTKHIDITRLITPANNQVHGHYYLTNSGNYVFQGFVDNVYSEKNIRIVADGAFHTILVLSKNGFTINPPYIGSN